MAENSKIEWTHHTFNPWIGCQKVGPGCDHCYAEAMMDARLGRVEWGPHGARQRTSPANWQKLLKWDRDAAAVGERRRVFCASLADVFDNHPSILPEWRADIWELIGRTPNLDWLLLTKRPGNIAKMLPPDWSDGYPNVWLGCTVVNQGEADRDIPKLLAVPAAVRFLSMEPLLGPVDLEVAWFGESALEGECWGDCAWCDNGHTPMHNCQKGRQSAAALAKGRDGLDLVIVGGESGPGARPMHPDWVLSLRDQCQAAGVAFFFKQWGEYSEGSGFSKTAKIVLNDGRIFASTVDVIDPDDRANWGRLDPTMMRKVGKARAGRLLDGRTWGQMPGVAG